MKHCAFILLFSMLILPKSFAQIDYDKIDLQAESKIICDLVDRLQQGSYHYFDCLDYTKSIVEKKQDLIKDIYLICSKSWLDRPDHCYSSLANSYFESRLVHQITTKEEWDQLSHIANQILFGSDFQAFLSSDPKEQVFQREVWSLEELMSGWKLSPLNSAILLCSRMMTFQRLLGATDEGMVEQNQMDCYQQSFEFLESRLQFK